MTNFDFEQLPLAGAFLIQSFSTGDNRGGFSKIFEKDIFREAGISFSLSETFFSVSAKNVIRGLHFQTHEPQAKLVSVVQGRIWDVIVDLRMDSPTFGKYAGHELSSENHLGFYVPRGFAHGFVSLVDNSIMLYQCDGKYDKATDSGVRFDDPDIGIEWPINEDVAIHSERDWNLQSLKEYRKHPMEV